MNGNFGFLLETADFGFGNVLSLLCGLALFLFGMDEMGNALKKSAGSGLKTILGKMTSNPVKGFLLGLVVTSIIQSSSATTVMVVGFVNSGTMNLLQAAGVIMGANVGTAVTSWLTALSGLGEMGGGTSAFLNALKPDSWMPILAVIGICLVMFVKRGKKKDIGVVLLGFSILMVGMSMMSDAVGVLKHNDGFKSLLTMFENPILGILAGLVLTAIVQSSSASVGILQSLTVTGAITYGAAIPIVMGQNIGTCVTALLSALGANKNGKRAAFIHLYYNIIGVIVVLIPFYIINAVLGGMEFLNTSVDMWGVAGIHTIFKIISVIILSPFYKKIVKLSEITVKEKKGSDEATTLLDERLINTPAIAVERATQVAYTMADLARNSLLDSIRLYNSYDAKLAEKIRDDEQKIDTFEDSIGSYLVKISSESLDQRDSEQITKLLHIIGDLERISDHAVNIVESAEEIRDKKIVFSDEAKRELSVMQKAVEEVLNISCDAFVNNDLQKSFETGPLEEIVDELRDKIKLNHIRRLQKSECTIEHGFVLSDLLTNFERVSDHCSNISACVIEISSYDALNMHQYNASIKHGEENFLRKCEEYRKKYSI